MTKKRSSEILGMKIVCKILSRPPKLGARSQMVELIFCKTALFKRTFLTITVSRNITHKCHLKNLCKNHKRIKFKLQTNAKLQCNTVCIDFVDFHHFVQNLVSSH